MTQQATAPRAPRPQTSAPAPVGVAGVAGVADPAAARYTEDVPRLLNRLQVLAVVACVLFGVLGALVQVLSWQANGRAADNTEQVVRIQKIQSSLLRADALASNAFLVGGVEPAAARAEYDDQLDAVLSLVTDAARAQPADRQVLGQLNQVVSDYATAVTQARDNNRQGFPVGRAYLDAAGTALRGDGQAILDSLVKANDERAVDEMGGQHPVWLLVLGVLAIAALIVINAQVARRFHRRYNVGLVVAAAVVALLTIVTAVHASGKNTDNMATRDGAYRSAVDEASARTAANDAKAFESKGLINQGSGTAAEQDFAAAARVVENDASGPTLELWRRYVKLHDAIRKADDAGNYDQAVKLATSASPDGATAALDDVDATAAKATASAATEATDQLGSGGALSVLLAALTLLGALFAAGAATWGLNQRRREYS